MAIVKRVTLAEDPLWHQSRTIEAEPGSIEITLENGIIYMRVLGKSPAAIRIMNRMGTSFALREWQSVVFADEPASAAKK